MARSPLPDTIDLYAAYGGSDIDLRELLNFLGVGRVATYQTAEWVEVEDFCKVV